MKYILDTNIFNKILDGNIDVNFDGEFFVTHVQEDEIYATPNHDRKNQLLKIFKKIIQKDIPTESAVWDISKWDSCKWGGESNSKIPTESFVLGHSRIGMAKLSNDNLYSEIRDSLDKKKKKPNNVQDALIAETAIKNNLILVTDDKTLREVAKSYYENVISFDEFISGAGNLGTVYQLNLSKD
jgi:predicted nucleic acid-binding protein